MSFPTSSFFYENTQVQPITLVPMVLLDTVAMLLLSDPWGDFLCPIDRSQNCHLVASLIGIFFLPFFPPFPHHPLLRRIQKDCGELTVWLNQQFMLAKVNPNVGETFSSSHPCPLLPWLLSVCSTQFSHYHRPH